MQALELAIDQKAIAFKHVLMATDFSEPSQRALDFAVAITRRYGSTLSILHAMPPEPYDRVPVGQPLELNRRSLEAETQMAKVKQYISEKGLDAHLTLRRGKVWDALASAILTQEIDLLVLGTHGRGGLKKLALGSVAEEVLRVAPCPVLTVGPGVTAVNSGGTRFGRILFATDFGAASEKALPYALALAEEYQSELFLLHMLPPLPGADLGPATYGASTYGAEEFMEWQQTRREKSKSRLKELIPPDLKLAAKPEFIVRMDFLPEGLLETVFEKKIDLIVMGANRTGMSRVISHIPGSSTHEVICHAKCPVLTVNY
jgi:nucleotide-binding universal stress UspA family protein